MALPNRAATPKPFARQLSVLQQLQREIAWLRVEYEYASINRLSDAAFKHRRLLTAKRKMLNNLPYNG